MTPFLISPKGERIRTILLLPTSGKLSASRYGEVQRRYLPPVGGIKGGFSQENIKY
jgi:hypothetical protein